MKIDPSQVQRTEEVTTADGRKYQRKIVRLTPEQRAEYRRGTGTGIARGLGTEVGLGYDMG